MTQHYVNPQRVLIVDDNNARLMTQTQPRAMMRVLQSQGQIEPLIVKPTTQPGYDFEADHDANVHAREIVRAARIVAHNPL